MPKNHDGLDLCHFTYADGRRCTLPQFPDDMGLCYHHAQKRSAHLRAEKAGRQISDFLDTDIITACDLTSALGALFAATAQGVTKPKTAIALGYIGQLLFQTQKLAKEEYLEAFEEEWFEVVQEGPAFNPPEPEPEPGAPTEPPPTASDPAPAPLLVSEPPPTAGPDATAPNSDDSSASDDDLAPFPEDQDPD